MFHVVGGMLPTSLILISDLMLLYPYFHGTVRRTGAPSCMGKVSPNMPTVSMVSGCMASSSRKPSTYGRSIPANSLRASGSRR